MMIIRLTLIPFLIGFSLCAYQDLIKETFSFQKYIIPLVWLAVFAVVSLEKNSKQTRYWLIFFLLGGSFSILSIGGVVLGENPDSYSLLLFVFLAFSIVVLKISLFDVSIAVVLIMAMFFSYAWYFLELNLQSILSATLGFFVVFQFGWIQEKRFYQMKAKEWELNKTLDSRSTLDSALIQSEKKYFRIFENIPDVYFECRLDGEIIEMSPSVLGELGYSRENLINSSFTKLFTNEDTFIEFVTQQLFHSKLRSFEFILKKAHGGESSFSVNTQMILDPSGKPIKIAGCMRSNEETGRIHYPDNNLASDGALIYSQALKEFQDDKTFLKGIIEGFIKQAESQVELIKESIDKGDWKTTAENAHSIKGGSANLVANKLSSAAAALEKTAKSEDAEEISSSFESLLTEMKNLKNWYMENSEKL